MVYLFTVLDLPIVLSHNATLFGLVWFETGSQGTALVGLELTL